jgi:flagellar biosynthesis protein FliQ
MSSDVVISIATQAMNLAFKVAMPLLLAGLIVSVFQAVTQIQEQTLAFIPKIIAIAAVLVILGPWMLGQILTYTTNLYESIPSLVGG